jgi:hypothetical protein
MKLARATFVAFAVLAVAVSASAQEAPDQGAEPNDPSASAQEMLEASIAGRPVHVGAPVRASTKWFPRDSACHIYCPQGTVLISTIYEDPQSAADCQPNDLMLCAPLSIR